MYIMCLRACSTLATAFQDMPIKGKSLYCIKIPFNDEHFKDKPSFDDELLDMFFDMSFKDSI